MGKGNGKSEGKIHLQKADLQKVDLHPEDLEHELTAGDGMDESASEARAAKPAEVGAASATASETEKLKAERDALLDRLARLQAEFDNARKRAVREQQDFREYAAAEVIKNLLPTLDSFERALKAGGDATDFRNGIEHIYRQFQDALQKIGDLHKARILRAKGPGIYRA